MMCDPKYHHVARIALHQEQFAAISTLYLQLETWLPFKKGITTNKPLKNYQSSNNLWPLIIGQSAYMTDYHPKV